MNHRHIDHRLTHTRVPLLVLAQTTITHKPTEPPPSHPRKAFLGPVQHRLTTALILNIRCMTHARDQHTQNIHQHMPFATAHFLTAIVAPLAATLRSLDRLAVEDGRRRCGLLTGLSTHSSVQGVVNAQPQAVATPTREIGGHGAPRREVVRQLPPLAAGALQVEDGVENTAVIQAASSATFVGFGQQGLNQGPLGIREIAGIGWRLAHAHILRRRSIRKHALSAVVFPCVHPNL